MRKLSRKLSNRFKTSIKKLLKNSDPDQSAVVGQLVKETGFVLTASRENLNTSPAPVKRITPVPPPSLDTTRDLITPEPDLIDSDNDTTTVSNQSNNGFKALKSDVTLTFRLNRANPEIDSFGN